MKSIIRRLIVRLIMWCMEDGATTNEVFNSVRINALITELECTGYIDRVSYENTVSDSIYDLISRRGCKDGNRQAV